MYVYHSFNKGMLQRNEGKGIKCMYMYNCTYFVDQYRPWTTLKLSKWPNFSHYNHTSLAQFQSL